MEHEHYMANDEVNIIRVRVSYPAMYKTAFCVLLSSQPASFLLQLQTRSADEPMTTFVYCNECGHRWKVRAYCTMAFVLVMVVYTYYLDGFVWRHTLLHPLPVLTLGGRPLCV